MPALGTAHRPFIDDPGSAPDFPRAAPRDLRLRRLIPSAISDPDVNAWLELEERSLEPNAYLSPLFVVAACAHLQVKAPPEVLFLEAHDACPAVLKAVMVLQSSGPSRHLMLPHHEAYLSPHSMLGGALIAREGAAEVAAHLLDAIRRLPGHGLVFQRFRTDGPMGRVLRSAAEQAGIPVTEVDAFSRAAVDPRRLGEAYLSSHLASRLKKARGQARKLAARGPVGFRILRGGAVDADAIERHLALEHMGWKGSEGTSLRSKPEDEAFFRRMALDFAARGRAFFAELTVGERVIASSSNFIAGSKGFAFKIGFDPEFAKHGPGILCELELMRHAPQALGDLDELDSGAVAGSYLEELWPDRHTIASVALATSSPGRLTASATSYIRYLKRTLAGT